MEELFLRHGDRRVRVENAAQVPLVPELIPEWNCQQLTTGPFCSGVASQVLE